MGAHRSCGPSRRPGGLRGAPAPAIGAEGRRGGRGLSPIDALLLGLLQGLTEFLPVSSSGHLVLVAAWLGIDEPHLYFDVAVHGATLLAVTVVYRRSLLEMLRATLRFVSRRGRSASSSQERLALARLVAIVVGSIPTAVIGLLFRRPLEGLFQRADLVGYTFLVTALLLLSTRWASREGREGVGVREALVIGTVQGLAIVPGISRSGSTIAVALLLGVDREEAARFSFLLSMPAILGAVVLQVKDGGAGAIPTASLALGFGAALVAGIGALLVLLPIVRKGRLHHFAPYLLAAAAAVFWTIR